MTNASSMGEPRSASRATAEEGFAAGLVALRAQELEPTALGYTMRDRVLHDELTSDDAVAALVAHYASLASETTVD